MSEVGLYAFAAGLVLMCVCERVLNTFLWLFSPASTKKGKASEAYQVCGGALGMGISFLSGITSALVKLLTLSLTALFWLLILFLFLSILSTTYSDFPGVWLRAVDYYNARVGPFVHGYLLFPLQLLSLCFRGFIPVFNAIVWIARVVTTQGLLPILFDEVRLLINIGVSFMQLGTHFAGSCVNFVTAAQCVNATCLLNPPDLDLVTPMGDLRTVAVLSTGLVGEICSIMAIPADLLLYPFLDVNLARAVHQIANAVLHLFVVVPIVTERRCTLYGKLGVGSDTLMCTPDFESVYTRVIGGVRSLGQLVDNWISVAFAISQRTLGGLPEPCPEPVVLGPDTFRAGLLEGETAVVGLTEWTLAATNATVAYFYGANQDGIAPRVWPIPIDPSLGVAAVSYGEVQADGGASSSQGARPGATQTTTLFGCTCLDSTTGIAVRCAFLPLYGTISAADATLDVWFQDATWVADLTCAAVEISVRSVRWPLRRFEGTVASFGPTTTTLPTTDCTTRGTCESVDATIWLVPKCSLLPTALCDATITVGTSCFPFCMAARIAGARNANPVLVNARTWREGKQLLARDCVLHATDTASPSSTLPSTGVGIGTAFVGATAFSNLAGGSSYATAATASGTLDCRAGINTLLSLVPKPDSEYRLPFVRMAGQPFAIAGDTLLLEDPQPDGGTMVQVERLTGDQRDVFTLQRTFNDLTAAPKRLVPADEFAFDPRDTLVVPYEYEATRIHSTSSRNYVFYAVSPAMQIFSAFLNYCSHPENLPQFQFIILSSYGPLRIYRVRAYCEKTSLCPDISSKVDLDGFLVNGTVFEPNCTRQYNATIEGLEYINEQNIAVVVQVADHTFDPLHMQGSGSQYVTYWLNPQTMAIQVDRMWRGEAATTADGTGLCLTSAVPLPRLGALVAELANVAVFVSRFVVEGVVSTPGLVMQWRATGGTCPLVARGHSALASCGRSVYSLDDMYDSIEDASATFWSILGFAANVISTTPVAEVTPLVEILRGTAAVGAATVSVYEVSGGVAGLLKSPIPAQIESLFGVVTGRTKMQSAAHLASSGSTWSRFATRIFMVIGVDMVIALCSVPEVTVAALHRILTNGIYDQRAAFQAIVADRAKGGCEGVRIIFGGDNPWANVLYHLCMSSADFLNGAYDFGMSLFVEAPMVKCICKDAAGQNVRTYGTTQCAPATPSTLRPTLLSIIALESDNALLCPDVIGFVRVSMEGTFEPWFKDMYNVLDALGSSVDYALIGFDDDAGQCLNFADNSNVVVILPDPIDYFQACGTTSDCHSKCSSEWNTFLETQSSYAASQLVSTATTTQTVESLFFPTTTRDMVIPSPLTAMVQPETYCGSICRSGSDQCVAVSYAGVVAGVYSIRYYCVPSGPSDGAYAAGASSAWDFSVDASNTVESMSFLWTNGTAMVLQVLGRGGTWLQIVSSDPSMERVPLNVTPSDSSCVPVLQALGARAIRIVDFLSMGLAGHLVVNVAARVNVDGSFSSDVYALWINPWAASVRVVSIPSDLWRGYTPSEFPLHSDTTASFLFWPQATGVPQRVVFDWSTPMLAIQQVPMQMSNTLAAKATLVPQNLILSKNLINNQDYYLMFASTGSTYDWLSQLRLTRSGMTLLAAHVVNSQPITSSVTVQTGCDGTDCRACPTELRSMCAVYQSCAVFRCIGTPVNLQRPLCGIGLALRSAGMIYAQTLHGSWTMFVELFMLLLQLSTQRHLSGVNLAFPSDNFFGHICAVKDLSAEIISILASAVNGAMQLTQVADPRLQMAASVDSGTNAVLSMSTMAITSFFNQVCLLPVYLMVVGHKIMMCDVSGWIAVLGKDGVSVTLQQSEMASAEASMVGSCLTVNSQIQAQQTGDASVLKMVGTTAAALVTNAAQRMIITRLEPLTHMFDGAMTYLMGIVSKFGSMLQAFDLRHCVLPDVTLSQTVQCACGDTPLRIPAHRAAETVSDFGLWCSGTLALTDASNRQIIVYNPYSYAQLHAMLENIMDSYIQCASSSFQCSPPNDPVFSSQGVSIIPVFTRCRQNYVNNAWDIAAYALFDQEVLNRAVPRAVTPLAVDPLAGGGVGACLLDSAAKGGNGGACLDAFMRERGLTETYWAYEPATVPVQDANLNIGGVWPSGGPLEAAFLNTFLKANGLPLAGSMIVTFLNQTPTEETPSLTAYMRSNGWSSIIDWSYTTQGDNLLYFIILKLFESSTIDFATMDTYVKASGIPNSAKWAIIPAKLMSSSDVDACVVFSGPAGNQAVSTERRSKFQSCLNGYSTGMSCDLSGFVWSPASENDVPVASRHVITGNFSAQGIVTERYAAARKLVIDKLNSIGAYNNQNLNVAFFSAEGDMLHQLMDCVFMGPYSRVDYWPQHRCTPSSPSDCLVGPYWSRDDGAGASRTIDSEHCQATTELPFTCGSPMRKAMTHYFVQQYLLRGIGGADLIREQINNWLRDVRAAWMDSSTYGCECPGGNGTKSAFCCSPTDDSPLPDSLNRDVLYLNTTNVLAGIEKRMKDFYGDFKNLHTPYTTNMDPSELSKYDWTTAQGAHWVEDEARYDTTAPQMRFDRQEAQSPPREGDESLWYACHGAMQQVLFTMPVTAEGGLRDPVVAFSGGGPEAIAKQVEALVQAAYKSSPLYRHYVTRHHPSASVVCEQQKVNVDPGQGNVNFSSFIVDGFTVFDGSKATPLPVHGASYAQLGAWGTRCFCGWEATSAGNCMAPPAACVAMGETPSASGCVYSLAKQDRAALAAMFDSASWPCPELELSEHMGFLDRDSTEAWLRGEYWLTSSGESILRHGTGGLVAGNIPGLSSLSQDTKLDAVLRQRLAPGGRSVDPQIGVLTGCLFDAQLDQNELINGFVEGLFPMAQGITESATVSYCLRYAIELARLRALELSTMAMGSDQTHESVLKQKGVVGTWMRRCGSQVQLVAMCQALDIFHNYALARQCKLPFTVRTFAADLREVYITPECLVFIDGIFYDPCRCHPEWCTGPMTTVLFPQNLTASCAMRFDPRGVVRAAELAWWPGDLADPALASMAANANAWLAEPWNLLDFEAFVAQALATPQGIGNVPLGQSWQSAEGFMNETGQFCDMIADYWPDEALFPVGYHATTPCTAADAAYRTFDNVFAREDEWLTYYEDQTRDGHSIGSRFGAGGLCSGVNFGFDMYETNTMRVCTRLSDKEDVDIHVPLSSSGGSDAYASETCSESSTQLPWAGASDYAFYEQALYNIGTVPHLPRSTDTVYPTVSAPMWTLGPTDSIRTEGWGTACQDLDLPVCGVGGSWNCPSGFSCLHGVCMQADVQCTQHADCTGGRMCSGVGTCVQPRVVVQNWLDTSVSFKGHTAACPGTSFSMIGASPWGYVPDILTAHGMCSYRHWQEYLTTLAKQGCSAYASSACLVNDTSTPVYAFDQPNSPPASVWWDPNSNYPNRLKVIPVTCDRDYERFMLKGQELKACIPASGNATIRLSSGAIVYSFDRERILRTHESAKMVQLGTMPFASNVTWGFLGSKTPLTLRSCGQFHQCYADTFTQNGAVQMTIRNGLRVPNRLLIDNNTPYDAKNIFTCGFPGYSTGTSCVVDTKLFPLYNILCNDNMPSSCSAIIDTSSSKPIMERLSALCNVINKPYSPTVSYIEDTLVPALSGLFQVFIRPATVMQHLQAVDCMNSIYSTISAPPYASRALYFPFSFTAYEFPISWYYQCIIGAGISPDIKTRRTYTCSYQGAIASVQPSTYIQQTGGSDSFQDYIRFVRAGYTFANLTAYANAQAVIAQNKWRTCVDQTTTNLFGPVDVSMPMCYQESRWILDPETYDLNLRTIISTKAFPVCAAARAAKALDMYNNAHKTNYILSTIMPLLVKTIGNPTAQNRGIPTLMSKIRDYGVRVLEQAKDINRLVTTRVTATDRYPVSYNNAVPTEQSDMAQLLTSLVNSPAYQPATDSVYPALNCTPIGKAAGIPTVQLYNDAYDQMMGMSTRVCPIYRQGTIDCAYPQITVDGTVFTASNKDLTSNDWQQVFASYFQGIMSHVSTCYTQQNLQPPPRAVPDSLPFFEEEYSMSFQKPFSFDLSAVSAFQNNINPDPTAPVMCVLANQTMDYTKCTDRNYGTLKAHVQSRFDREGPVVIPSMAQLTWDVTSDMLEQGSLFSYASTARNLSYQYVWSILDDTTSCAADMSPEQRVCNFNRVGAMASASVIAPWLDGMWNPFDQCDVTQTDIDTGYTENIDVSCSYPDKCPPGDFFVDYFRDMPNAQNCIANQGKKTSQLNIDQDTPYNLCKRRVVQDQICMHEQGMVGGTDGMPTFDYNKGDIYTLNELYDLPDGLDEGLFGSSLFRGLTQDYGLLRIPSGHISGDTIGMRIQKDPSMKLGNMQVTKVPMKPVSSEYVLMNEWESQTVDKWVAGLASSFALDDAVYRQQLTEATQPVFAWDCPLRRRAYYANAVSGFGPSLPSARRAQRLFYNLTKGAYAHPTQLRSRASDYFGDYATTNGFCFCPTSESKDVPDGVCSVPVRNQTTHPCSLWNTIRAISGEAWGTSFAFPIRTSDYMMKTCSMQLDWPFVGGNLRDGSTLLDPETSSNVWAQASDPEGHRCHVLDRMRPFSYIYRSVNELHASGRTTLDAGVCHTGRPQSGFHGAAGRCTRLTKTATSASLTCESDAAFTVARRSSTTPPVAASNSAFSRQRCGQCSPLPKFRTRGGAQLPQQSSFGLPYRLSAERSLANDLVRALCHEPGITTADCTARLNASAWQPGVFLPTYLSTPRQLLRSPSNATPIADEFVPSSSVPPDDALWAHPWVYCPSRTALRTGACNGSIPKALWRARKVQACHAAIDDALQGQPDPMGKTAVCNMDSTLSALCAAIEEAKTLVAGANCLASGNSKCAVQEFVYTPATWEHTNHKFVHQTVFDYYRLADAGICPVTDDVAALITQNAAIVKDCAANPVFAFYDVIQAVRNIVDTIVQAIGHAISMAFQLCLTLVTTSRSNAKAQTISDWHELKRLTSSAVGTISDLVIDLALTSGTAGPWIRHAMGEVCALSNTAYRYFADVYCTLVVTSLPSLLLGIKSVSTWTRVGFQVLNDFMSVILKQFLPKAFVQLLNQGYGKGFQASSYQATKALYTPEVDPTSKVAKQARPLSAVQREAANPSVNNAAMKNLGGDMQKNINADVPSKKNVVADTGKKTAGNVIGKAKTAGRAAAVLQIAQTGLEIYEEYQELQALAEAFENYPDTWTIFDFSLLFGVIDDMMDFLQSDLTCFSTIKSNPLPCNFIGLAELNVTGADAMAPGPSQCWAEAQERQVGVTTLYACTAASTCLRSPTDSDVVLCASCPPNSNPLFHTYGCNTMLQLCQCGTQVLDVTGCVAHRDCAAPDAACSVLAALGDISFGTVACSACSSSPVCLLDSTRRGKCTCLSTGTSELDICSVPAGQHTIPTPSRLCGYAYDPSAYYFWSDLALLLCTNVHTGVCAEVTSDSIGTFFMTVASQTPSSQSNRRLLMTEEAPTNPLSSVERRIEGFRAWPSWNHTAEPCAGIALALEAGAALGPVDSTAADMCLFWRSAARTVISSYNLTELEPFDHFLLSMEDFADALHQRGVLQTFLSHPEALLEAILQAPLLQPLRIFHRILLHRSHNKRWFAPHQVNVTMEQVNASENATDEANENITETPRRRLLFSTKEPSNISPVSRKPLSVLSDVVDSLESSPLFQPFAAAAKRITIPEVPARLSVLYAQSTLRGPLAWPRVYFDGLCPPVQAVAVAIARSMTVVHTYYARFPEIAAAPAAPFRVFPDFTAPANWTAETLHTVQAAGTNAKSITTWAFDATLAAIGMTTRDLAFFLSDPCGGEDCSSRNRITLLYALDTALSCDFEAVMYCNLHTRDLFSSSVFALVVYLVLAFIGSATGLTILPMLFFMASPAFILWYSFGLSIGCVPMLPTCFIDSFIASASAALPLNVSMPSLLLDCAPAPCLRSCASLGFSAWSDPLVFFACSLGLGPLLQDYVADVAVKQAMTTSPDSAAYAVCAVVSSASSIPFLMLAGSILTAVWALVTLILELLPPLASLLWHVVAYSHARAAEPE